MSKKAHTPGEWEAKGLYVFAGNNCIGICDTDNASETRMKANAKIMAAAPEMLEALRLHKAWSDSESSGPDYGGQTRDTHPDGESIWRAWWNSQLDLCDRAQKATDAALSKATGGE